MGTTARSRTARWSMVLATVVGVLVALTPAPATAAEDEKVTLCHRTTSPTNPYNQNVVAKSAAANAHGAHTGPIFRPGLQQWGDIIPPVPGLPDGLNWPEGRRILENGCETRPDVGPLPSAVIGPLECVEQGPSLELRVANDSRATAPATFNIAVDGTVVQTVGPLRRGQNRVVVLTDALAAFEDQTVTIEVRSGGEVIASRVVTVDCSEEPPAGLVLDAQLECQAQTAIGTLTATNDGQAPVELTATVDGAPVGSPVTVAPGATETASVDLSGFEDQSVTVTILANGEEVASYTITPDCVAPRAVPRANVGTLVCPPPLLTVTLANDGEPDSFLSYAISVDGRVVQDSADIYGGDETTIVLDLSAFEDRTVRVAISTGGEVVASKDVRVNCEQPSTGPGDASDTPVPTVVPAGAAESTGAARPGPGLAGGGLLLVLLGLLTAAARGREPRRR